MYQVYVGEARLPSRTYEVFCVKYVEKSDRVGLIIGLTVGLSCLVVLVIVIIVLVVVLRNRRRRRQQTRQTPNTNNPNNNNNNNQNLLGVGWAYPPSPGHRNPTISLVSGQRANRSDYDTRMNEYARNIPDADGIDDAVIVRPRTDYLRPIEQTPSSRQIIDKTARISMYPADGPSADFNADVRPRANDGQPSETSSFPLQIVDHTTRHSMFPGNDDNNDYINLKHPYKRD